jgi:hypothetical protein
MKILNSGTPLLSINAGGVHLTALLSWVLGALIFWLGRNLQIGGAIPSFIVAALIYPAIMRGFGDR